MSSERTEITEHGRAVAPADDDDDFDLPPPSIRANNAGAMEVFFAWEKLRLVYNGVLLVVSLSICGWAVVDVVVEAVLAALCANLMYCAGPVGECYLTWFGVPGVAARSLLFVLGLVLSVLIVLAIVVVHGIAQNPMG
jgi:hypothetical protein